MDEIAVSILAMANLLGRGLICQRTMPSDLYVNEIEERSTEQVRLLLDSTFARVTLQCDSFLAKETIE